MALLDRKIAAGRDFTEIDSNVYLAWSNALTRTLARLRLDSASMANAAGPTLDQYLANRYADGSA